MISVIKEPGLVWSIQEVIPKGATFKLGQKGCMYVNQKHRWKLGTLQAEVVRNLKCLRIERNQFEKIFRKKNRDV